MILFIAREATRNDLVGEERVASPVEQGRLVPEHDDDDQTASADAPHEVEEATIRNRLRLAPLGARSFRLSLERVLRARNRSFLERESSTADHFPGGRFGRGRASNAAAWLSFEVLRAFRRPA